MSIDGINIGSQGIDRTNSPQPNELTRSAGTDRHLPPGSDSVALSSKANELTRLVNTIEQSRTKHFNRVRAALESGAYEVSANDIAEKLIDANRMTDM